MCLRKSLQWWPLIDRHLLCVLFSVGMWQREKVIFFMLGKNQLVQIYDVILSSDCHYDTT